MPLSIRSESASDLRPYATIPCAFVVDRRLEVTDADEGRASVSLTDVLVDPSWVKDYDQITGGAPTGWATRFDTTTWGVLAAFDGDERVGGAVVAVDTPGMFTPDGRGDRAVLWDIRVRPERRGHGVGRALFDAVCAWSRDRHCRDLWIETQDINVAACRFYATMGCELVAVDRLAYPDLPGEVELDWSFSLSSRS